MEPGLETLSQGDRNLSHLNLSHLNLSHLNNSDLLIRSCLEHLVFLFEARLPVAQIKAVGSLHNNNNNNLKPHRFL